eukprot:m.1461261 g.1461261  ORF g.1461261 m.1461261 type:complete len:1747 (-) comp25131_c0_seq8:123-5363(-)
MSSRKRRAESAVLHLPSPTEKKTSKDGKKRKTSSQKDSRSDKDLISEIWELVMNQKTKRGRRLSVSFMHVPTKKEDPNYAVEVEQPMDLSMIKKNKAADEYTFTDIVEDLNVMCSNTRLYYKEKDEIWQDACRLTRVVNAFYKDAKLGHLFGVPRIDWRNIKSAPPKNLMNKLIRIVDVVKAYKKKGPAGGYVVSEIFMQIPSKKDLPDYHRIVTDPIDIITVEKKVLQEEVPRVLDLVLMLTAMFENAVLYNPVGNEVHEDAIELMEFMHAEACKVDRSMTDALTVRLPPVAVVPADPLPASTGVISVKTADTINVDAGAKAPKKAKAGRKSSATTDRTVAVTTPSAEEVSKRRKTSDSGGSAGTARRKDNGGATDGDITDEDAVQYEEPKSRRTAFLYLYNYITQYKDADGNHPADALLELPTRAEMPEYYAVIKEPLALERVGGRIKANKYTSYDEVLQQVDLVCDNAMAFNEEGSECFVAGDIIKRVTRAKVAIIRRRGVPVGANAANTRPVTDAGGAAADGTATDRAEGAAGGGGAKKGASSDRKVAGALGAGGAADASPGSAETKPASAKRPRSGKKDRKNKDDEAANRPLRKTEIIQMLYDTLLNAEDEDGFSLIEEFMELPKRRELPHYYTVIDKPMDMVSIASWMRGFKYSSPEDVMEHFELMIDNAHKYNEEGSEIYKDASALRAILHAKYDQIKKTEAAKLANRKDRPRKAGLTGGTTSHASRAESSSGRKARQQKAQKKTPEDVQRVCQDILRSLNAVQAAGAGSSAGGGAAVAVSVLEPIPVVTADGLASWQRYHSVVNTPLDMETVQHRVAEQGYTRLVDFVQDVNHVLTNAVVAATVNKKDVEATVDRLFGVLHVQTRELLSPAEQAEVFVADGVTAMHAAIVEIYQWVCDTVFHLTHDRRTASVALDYIAEFELSDFGGVNPTVGQARPLPEDIKRDVLGLAQVHARIIAREYDTLGAFVHDLCDLLAAAAFNARLLPSVRYSAQRLYPKLTQRLTALVAERRIDTRVNLQHRMYELNFADPVLNATTKVVAAEEKEREEAERASAARANTHTAERWAMGSRVGRYVNIRVPSNPLPGYMQLCYVTALVSKPGERVRRYQGHVYLRADMGEAFAQDFEVHSVEVFRTHVLVEFSEDDIVDDPNGTFIFVVSMEEYTSTTINVKDASKCVRYFCRSEVDVFSRELVPMRNYVREGPQWIHVKHAAKPVKLKNAVRTDVVAPSLRMPRAHVDLILGDVRTTRARPASAPTGKEHVGLSSIAIKDSVYTVGEVVLLRPGGYFTSGPGIVLITSISLTPTGKPQMEGRQYHRPGDTEHAPTRTFYENEVMLSTVASIFDMRKIIRKCAVLSVADYQRQRPFNIPDQYVFVCESKYDLQARAIARLDPATDLPVPLVPPAETTTFPFPLTLTKVPSPHAAMESGAVVVDGGGGRGGNGGRGGGGAPISPAKPPHVRKRLQTKENLEKELGSSRSQIEEAKKKLSKLVDRAIRQAARLAAIDKGGDGSEIDELLAPSGGEDAGGGIGAAFDKAPDIIDGRTLFVRDSYAKVKMANPLQGAPIITFYLQKQWESKTAGEKAPWNQKALQRNATVTAAYLAGRNERDTHAVGTASAAARAAAAVLAATTTPKASLTKGAAGTGGAATAVPRDPAMDLVDFEKARNPTTTPLTKGYQDFLAKAAAEAKKQPVMDASRQRAFPSAAPPPQVVVLKSVEEALSCLEHAIDKDVDALHRVFV